MEKINNTGFLQKENDAKTNVIVSVTLMHGLGQFELLVFFNGSMIQSFHVSHSSCIEVNLPLGLFLFVFNGFGSGEVTIDVHGDKASVTPDGPINFSSGYFRTTFTVSIK